MSKTQLKKELQQLDKDGIIQMVLDLYTARKEARDYLDFFINPDVDARLDKARLAIAKELVRGRHESKARISHIKRIIKDFTSLQPGEEPTAELMVYTIEAAFRTSKIMRYKNVLINGIENMVNDTVGYLDSHELLPAYLPRLEKASHELSRWSSMKQFMHHAIESRAAKPDKP